MSMLPRPSLRQDQGTIQQPAAGSGAPVNGNRNGPICLLEGLLGHVVHGAGAVSPFEPDDLRSPARPAQVREVLVQRATVHVAQKGPGRTSCATWLRSLDVPFTCDACGAGRHLPLQIPPDGMALRCPQCGDERRFVRPPLLIVTGTAGAGKSTICARLAGTIPGAVLLDADVFASDMVSVVPPMRTTRPSGDRWPGSRPRYLRTTSRSCSSP